MEDNEIVDLIDRYEVLLGVVLNLSLDVSNTENSIRTLIEKRTQLLGEISELKEKFLFT